MRPMPWVPCPEGSFRRATLTLSCLNIVLRSKGSGPKALKRKREGARERERYIYICIHAFQISNPSRKSLIYLENFDSTIPQKISKAATK